MENILKPKGMLCNVRKMIKWIIVHNRLKDNCNIFQFHLILFVVFVYTFIEENNHDCLGVMQSLYYKSSSKHVLKSERDRKSESKELGTGIERERYRPIKKSTVI